MTTLTRTGYMVPNIPKLQDIKKELTVRPIVNGDYGFPPPPFKVFKPAKNGICVPRFYGTSTLGEPDNDRRPEPKRIKTAFVGKLRDATHQNEALAAALKAGHGVLSLPCGYGKTTVSLAIACNLGYRTMIVVHKQFLADQWKERIQQFCPGATIGIVQQDRKEVECDFVIAMLQSLSLKEYNFSDFESIGTLIVDEAHHVCAKVFSQSLFKLCPRHIYGLSATPERKDGLTKVLHWFMGPTFFAVERKNQEQVQVFTIVYESSRFRDPPPSTRNGKISMPSMITELVEDRERNKMLVALVKRASAGTRQLLVLSDRRLHCEFLHQCFPKSSGLYMGGMKEEQLQESSKKKIIFATFSQAHEGLDIPTLDTVILASPKSDITQSIGRIMRETKGKKNNPQIFDIHDKWSVFSAMYYKRLKVYRQGGFMMSENGPSDESTFPQGKCLFL
uniref:Helicase D10 n=1 Tax=Mantoniella tinhauana virus 1 TaxID=3111543 RepID=A0AB38ZMC2_9VIRU